MRAIPLAGLFPPAIDTDVRYVQNNTITRSCDVELDLEPCKESASVLRGNNFPPAGEKRGANEEVPQHGRAVRIP
jgi:hypothetical protein